ncbi:unnamed protein product [Gongylonema pulchrum]|uniref:Uncharacterized protein n=1 Tax=Gongylonema pulchrum TaxID=637853 RepID=A0A183EQ55_9BILA|nr:unnamed protein product [Gongylonema pulchrum]
MNYLLLKVSDECIQELHDQGELETRYAKLRPLLQTTIAAIQIENLPKVPPSMLQAEVTVAAAAAAPGAAHQQFHDTKRSTPVLHASPASSNCKVVSLNKTVVIVHNIPIL